MRAKHTRLSIKGKLVGSFSGMTMHKVICDSLQDMSHGVKLSLLTMTTTTLRSTKVQLLANKSDAEKHVLRFVIWLTEYVEFSKTTPHG